MTHTEALELLPLYSLDALEWDDQLQVDGHVAGCASCAAELDGYAAVARALGGELDPSPRVWEAIVERIEA